MLRSALESVGPARLPLSTIVAGNTFLNSLRFLTVFVAGLATSVLIARALGPHDFGIYRLVMGLVWGLEVISVLAIPNAVTRFVAEQDEPAHVSRVVGFHVTWTVAMYTAAVVPVLVFRRQLADFYHEDALDSLLPIAAAAVLPGVLAGVFAAGLRGRQRFRALGALAFAQAIIGVGSTGAVLAAGWGVRGLLAAMVGVNSLTLGLTWWVARGDVARTRRTEFVTALRARMRRYGIVMGVVALLGAVIWERSEIFFLGRWSPAADVGFYSLAYTLALQARRVAPFSLGEVLFPVISRLESVKDEWGVANASMASARYLAVVAFPFAVGGPLLAATVIRVLFGAAYLPAAPVLQILLVSGAVVAVAQPAATVIVMKERYRFLLTSSAVFTVANVALDVLLIPRWHAVGAAVANSIAQTAGSLVQLAYVAALLRTPLPIGNLARCLAATVAAFAPALALTAAGILAGVPGLTIATASFVVLYPLALARFRVLDRADFERLYAAARALPEPLRSLAGRGVGGVRDLAR
jgi:O-antigen/teichoic acid export membrane protein